MFTLLGLVVVVFLSINYCYAAYETEASVKLDAAGEYVELAFLSVNDLERMGGDISSLVVDLKEAIQYFDGSKHALESGDFTESVLLSRKAVSESEEIIYEAFNLKQVAKIKSGNLLRNQVIFSSLYSLLILVLGYIFWRFIKSYYLHQIMRAKPEVR